MSSDPVVELVRSEGEIVRLRYRAGGHDDVEVVLCLLDDDHFGADLRSVDTDRRYNVLARNARLMKDLSVPLYRRSALERPIAGGHLPDPPGVEPERLIVGVEMAPEHVTNGIEDVLSETPGHGEEYGRGRTR